MRARSFATLPWYHRAVESSENDPFVGRTLLQGQFEILQKVGAGGMGAVYKALQPAMNRYVAIKVLHPSLTARKDIASRFRREARAMSHLTHPNTVKVFLYGELEDGSLYIVMEYLEGKTLNQLLRSQGPLPVDRGLRIIIQACHALEEAHRAGMVHRDLKPENIFVTEQGGIHDFAKVLDFGLAKVTPREMRPGSLVLTREGMVFGTPEFMSPEQARGETLTATTDTYALAVITYEILSGKLPFNAKGAVEILQHHIQKPPIPIHERAPHLAFPEELWPVLAKALSKKPSDRFASAAQLAQAFEHILMRMHLASDPQAPAHAPAPQPFAVADRNSTPLPAVPTNSRPPTGVLIAIGLAFVVVGVLIAMLFMHLFAKS